MVSALVNVVHASVVNCNKQQHVSDLTVAGRCKHELYSIALYPRLDHSKGDLYYSRQLYDETIISEDEEDKVTVNDGPSPNKQGDMLKRGAG